MLPVAVNTPAPEWAQVAVTLGTVTLLLYIGHLLVVAPVVDDRELSEKREKILTIIATTALVVLALTRGVNLIGDYTGVGALYSTADGLAEKHLLHSATAYAYMAVGNALLQFFTVVPFIGGALSTILQHPLDALLPVMMSISLHEALLEFGHNYAMAVLFPVGLIFMLLPPLRAAGGVLVAHAIAFWIVLPAVMTGLYVPFESLIGAGDAPGDSLDILKSLTPSEAENLEHLGFMDWYLDEVTMWVYLPVLGMMLVEGSALLMVVALGGGQVIKMLRRLVRYVFVTVP